MRNPCCLAFVPLAALAGTALSGCSGSGSDSPSEPAAHGVKIQEYVGDGHNGTKPWPDFLGPSGPELQAVRTQGLAHPLHWNAAYVPSYVRRRNVNLFVLDPATQPVLTPHLITLQPVQDEDCDLYLLSAGPIYAARFSYITSSSRVPSAGTDRTKGGYAPDWCAIHMADSGTMPAFYVAVTGLTAGGATKAFHLEADIPGPLTVNGGSRCGSLTVGNSHWFRFGPTSAGNHTVILAAISGDPDLYVYGQESSDFRTGSNASGGASATFYSGGGGHHYVRVYAYTDCRYAIRVTGP